MRIQAYRRKTATPVDTGFNHVEFKPNDAGDVVADVDDDGDIAVLLSIPEAYCEYAPAEAEKPPAAKTSKAAAQAASTAGADSRPPADSPKFILKNGDETLDLGTLGDDELKAFAKANSIRLHYTWVGDNLRQRIADALKEG